MSNGHQKNISECLAAREKVLEAALELFARKGYLGASTREIAQLAGVAEITIFRHFSTKEGLLEEVINRYSLLPRLKDLLSQSTDLSYEEAISAVADRFLETLVELKDWIRIMHAEVQRSKKIYRIYHNFLDELYATFAGYFKEMQRRGKIRDFDPELGARAFQGMFFCFFNIEEIMNRKNYKKTDWMQAKKEFVRIFIEGTKLQQTATD